MNLSYKQLIVFSIPAIMGSMLEPIAGMVDTAFIGNTNTSWLASMAIAVSILSSFTWIFNFLVHTSTATIAQAYGQKDFAQIARTIKLSSILALILGISSSFLLYIGRYTIFEIINVPQSLINNCEKYLTIRLLGLPFIILFTAWVGVFRGHKKVNLVLWIILLITVVNIVLTYYLLNFSNLKIQSAAWATTISFIIGCALAFIYMLKHGWVKKYQLFKIESIPLSEWVKFKSDSLNLFMRSALLSGSFFMSTFVATQINATVLAAHQIALQIWLLFSFFVDGLAITANIFGANLIGQKQNQQLKVLFKKIITLGLSIGITISIVYSIFKENIIYSFTNDTLVFQELSNIWPLICGIQVINALAFIYDGILFGTRDFLYLQKHMLIGVVALLLPAFLWGYFNKSFLFIWIGLSLLNVYRVISGHFKTHKIAHNVF